MRENTNGRLQGSKYDKILRENMQFILPGIIEKVLKLNIVKSAELNDKIQITRQKEVDALYMVTDADGVSSILQVEFESSNRPKMHFRMAEYRSMLHQIYDQPINQYVMYMGKDALNMPSKIDLPGFKYEYKLISFSELPYELFLSSDEPEAQLLAVLANFGDKEPAEVIQAILEKIGKGDSDVLMGNKYYEQLRVIVQLRKLDKELEMAMDSVNTFWRKERDVLFKWGKKEGIEKGIQKGEHKKAVEVAKEMLVEKEPLERIAKYTKLSIKEIEVL
ncbi:RpnC/YadD family protein [Pedobacter hiemivivus]|uniref:Rpn family recombination-promoting nuclease/putative transposase n=1 Tax=Pedobacter hiemivivus TaxID=2530454 RepID=A0A4R0NBP4_9SPHI|nr:hypothetical protein [Pedobacter hiemivivus]TCC97605.1 hypothetical protein EZ444_06725 [Pedobacter hiemivivus]